MAAPSRPPLPWEARTGCPTCRAKPGRRCVTVATRYPAGYRFRDGSGPLGAPTQPHKARYELWCLIWGRTTCLAGAWRPDPLEAT
jgi:hypothetical protein